MSIKRFLKFNIINPFKSFLKSCILNPFKIPLILLEGSYYVFIFILFHILFILRAPIQALAMMFLGMAGLGIPFLIFTIIYYSNDPWYHNIPMIIGFILITVAIQVFSFFTI